MTTPGQNRQRQLDLLITDIAGDLMGVPSTEADAAMQGVLEQVLEFFSVDHSFLRRNDHDAGTTILKCEWPERPFIPDPDPLYEVPFSADPIFALCADLAETFIAYPDDSEEYRDRVEAASGLDRTTMAAVPLRQEDVTIGILGLVRHGDERWAPEEVTTLNAIASMIAQMWGRHDAESSLLRKAYYDDLTGLANRRLLQKRIEENAYRVPVSLLVIDVDNMRVINDGLTYAAGDRFLAAMADRLREIVRTEAVVARLEGDQFGVMITNTEPSNAEAMADRMVRELGRPFDLGGIPIVRSVSIGITHDSPSVISATEFGSTMLQDAGVAMSEAKKAGKNRTAVFDEDMHDRRTRDFQVEMQLRSAIDAGDQLCLHYQPEVDLRTGYVVACEALMRWNHPDRGLLAAGVFVEIAEESGLIVEIGDFVLREAVSQLARWQVDQPDLVMRVNVSPAHLMSRDLAGQIGSLIKEFGVRADRLCIEVTEHVMIADHQFTISILEDIRAMGVKVALDDFGTGYSSMEQLKRLPIDALKIDRAFMIELATSEKDAAIVDATIRLADALNMSTVAEGIEEEAQILQLLDRGCYRAQGYLLARPAAPEDTEQLFGRPLKAGSLQLGADTGEVLLPRIAG